MNAPSTTQSKRRQLFGILAGAVLLPALVALAVPDGSAGSADTEVAILPIAAQSAPVETAPSSTSTTEATTTIASQSTSTASSPAATTKKVSTATSTAPAPSVKKVSVAVAPTTTTTAAPVAAPAPPPPPPVDSGATAFLACVRQRESHGNYSVVSANGAYYGAYQFSISTWNTTAQHAGRSDLVGVLPSQASPADQDAIALALYKWQGKAPWGGHC
jgi:resuscitation-promoting factor RpfB